MNGWSHYIGGCHRIAPGRVEFLISTFTGELVGEFGLLLLLITGGQTMRGEGDTQLLAMSPLSHDMHATHTLNILAMGIRQGDSTTCPHNRLMTPMGCPIRGYCPGLGPPKRNFPTCFLNWANHHRRVVALLALWASITATALSSVGLLQLSLEAKRCITPGRL